MLLKSLSLLTLSALGATTAQFVSPPSDSSLIEKTGYANIRIKYKEVPAGICETRAGVKSYSGYAEVEPEEWIFFWFFAARNNASTAPLTSWINGGPGSSSMIGLFQELGPCRIDQNGNVVDNPYAWNEVSNMIFIDQPIATGLSYTKPTSAYVSSGGNIVTLPSASCPDYAQGMACGTYSAPNVSTTVNSTQRAAANYYKTLQGFMGVFPQYAREEFAFATESYGGHYGPTFTEYIEEQNAKLMQGAKKISLTTLLIGNGWFDPKLQYEAYYKYALGNYYDLHPYNATISSQVSNNLYGKGNCLDQISDCYRTGIDEVCSTADNFCATEVESFLDSIANRDEYDIRELQPDPFPPTFYVDYLNSPKIQSAIGAYTNFSESSITVGQAFSSTGDDGRESSTIENLRKVLDKGVYVVLYNGDADYNCNIFGNMAVADEVDHKGYSTAGWQKMKTSDNVRHGEVRQSGRFALARIYESGHEVPFYQPLAALELFERALNRKDIATGKQAISATFKTTGSTESTYREGNGTVQYDVVPTDATYNTTTNAPNPYKAQSQDKAIAEKKDDNAHDRSNAHRRPRQFARAMRPSLPERRSLHAGKQQPFDVRRH